MVMMCSIYHGHAQDTPKEDNTNEKQSRALVERQLEAYNSKDLEAFLALFSDSVEVLIYPNIPRSKGKAALRESFSKFFSESGDLHSEVLQRIVTGNVVIDQEKITGFSKDNEGEFYVTAIYTVSDGKIVEMRFIYP